MTDEEIPFAWADAARKERKKYYGWKLKNDLRALYHSFFYLMIIMAVAFLAGVGYVVISGGCP